MLAAAARGVFTLLQATAISDRWGAVHYGRLNGLLSAPALTATALAPWAGAALAGTLGGYPAVFAGLAGLAGLAVLARGAQPAASLGGRVHKVLDDLRVAHVHPGSVCSSATRSAASCPLWCNRR